MDLSKFKISDWLKVGGGAGFLIFGFFSWVKISGPGGFGGASGGNVFDFFFTGIIPWILIIGTAVITVLLVTGKMKAGSLPWPLIMLVATALGALLLILRLLINPLDGKDFIEASGGSVGRGIGMILSTIAGITAAVGAFLGFQESGGDLNDFKDMNKLKSSFGGGQGAGPGGGSTPPPPPPGMTPPPPPPPPMS